MSVFHFQAKDMSGKVIKGKVHAESEGEAKEKLRGQKLIPIEVNLHAGIIDQKAHKSVGIFSGVKSKDLCIFTRQLSALIGAGVPIFESIEGMIGPDTAPRLKEVLQMVLNNLREGHSLANSMAIFPDTFNKMYVNMVRAGEESGSLPKILGRLADYIEKSTKLKGQIFRAMWYPAIIILIAIGISFILFAFVIPSFVEMFSFGGSQLPPLTLFVIGVSDLVATYWYLILAFLLGVPIGLRQMYRSEKRREWMDRVLIHIPLFGVFITQGAMARCSRTISLLLDANVRTTETLEMTAAVAGNFVITRDLLKSKELVIKGKSLSDAFRSCSNIPDMVSDMIHVGEQTGRVDYMFEKVADFYEDEMEATMGSIFNMIEPVMMVVLGGIIAVVVLALYLPIFNIAEGLDLNF